MATSTPISGKNTSIQEPLFTPLSFVQRLAAEQIKASPLRVELLKERFLGNVDGSSFNERELNEGSSVDPEPTPQSPGDFLMLMQSEYEQRTMQRNDILADVKMSRERIRQCLTHAETSATSDSQVHQQLSLLRRFHAEELNEKQQLIMQLTCVVRDLEHQNERLRGLRRGKAAETSPATSNSNGGSSPVVTTPTTISRSNMRGLVDQIERLQSEKALLNDEILNLRSTTATNCLAEFEMLRNLNADLVKDKQRLQEQIDQIRLSSATDSLNAEKRIHLMEGEIEKLTRFSQGVSSQSESCHEKEKLTMCQQCSELQKEVRSLKSVNDDLRVQLLTAETRSPEVVTKIRHLGELNINNPEELARANSQARKARKDFDKVNEELILVKDVNNSMKAELGSMKSLVEFHAEQVKDLELKLASSVHQITEKKAKAEALLISNVQPSVVQLINQLNELRNIFCSLKESTLGSFKEATSHLVSQLRGVEAHCHDLKIRYRQELELRKKYHNELVELKGNIRVLCRVRPVIAEDGKMASTVVAFDGDDNSVLFIERNKQRLKFTCDRVFPMQSTQEEVFSEVQQLVTSCVDGYNVCIFAYGQTGSGKTFTMEGTEAKAGINTRTLISLFEEINARAPDWNFELKVSALEIYNENIRDLLNDESNEETLEVKMTHEDGVGVPGLTWVQVNSVQDICKILSHVNIKRATAATSMNNRSSRSHTVIGITVKGTNAANTRVIGRLNLVDLAGSERVSKSGAEGDRLKEAQHINLSLLALGDVIHALQKNQAHVPYRNSRLTYLLQHCLGGESKTLMLMNVSPVEKNVLESCATMSFAQRVMSVELGPARKRLLAANADGNSEIKTPTRGCPTPSKVARKK